MVNKKYGELYMILHSQPTIEKDDIEVVLSQLKTGMIAKGEKVVELEDSLKNFIGINDAISTSSGRSALILGLLILGLEKDDEIILPTYVCRSVYDAIKFVGAKPIVVDIDDNYCISPTKIEKNISGKTKAIIVVHIFGITARINEILEIANRRKIAVIEDIAQSIGGELNGKKLGSFGSISFGSMQATKVITSGEGGFLLIKDEHFLDNYNKVKQNIGFRSNLSDLSASLALNQLKKINLFIDERKMLAKKYIEYLKQEKDIDIPIDNIRKSIFFRFPIRIKKDYCFDKLRKEMNDNGIQIRKGVDLMLHQIDKSFECKNADNIFKETITLPIYPHLNLSNVKQIYSELKYLLG
jgi:UDP-4-amino-4-deoxy-L-arabinose-oxoglutarate aminotransferase